MQGKHFEDHEVGDSYVSPWRIITESDLRRFLDLTSLREPLFYSARYREEHSPFERPLATGYLTLTFSTGLFSRSNWLEGTGMALLGIDGVSFEAPVFIDDEIRVTVTVSETRDIDHDDGGLVRYDWETERGDGTTVMEMETAHLMARRS